MMMKIRDAIAYKNVVRRPARSAALLLLVGLLSLSVLCAALVVGSLRRGFTSLEERLGADIMVVPYEAATKSDLESIVLQGNMGYFYMNGEIYDEIAALPGVERATAQYFLSSASSSCCSIPVQIIGFDPATDFTITPWIRRSTSQDIGYLDVVIGNDLNAFVGDTLSFYGTDVHVAAKLDKTGTHYDTAVFATKETLQTLIASSMDKKLNAYADVNAGNVVSCVLIDVADDYDIEDVLNDINLHIKKVKAVRTKNMISGIAASLSGVSDVAEFLGVAVWVLAIGILTVAFAMMAHERQKEFAVLRMVGASRGLVSRMLLLEGLGISLVGSMIGTVLGLLVILPFSGYIETRLGLPFLLPSWMSILIVALGAVLLAVVSGAVASGISAYRIGRTDAGLILREG